MTDARVPLAGCDFTLPAMGVGTWAWGDTSTWGMDGYDRSYSFDTIRDAYRTSVAAGVTFLDTAEMYGFGESERIIARLLEEDRANRDRVVVATKFFPAPWRVAVSSALMAALKASLERLKMPWVHLYQIHGPTSLRSHQAMAAALAEPTGPVSSRPSACRTTRNRKMRAIHAALAAHGVPLATNQIEFSLLRTMPESNGLLRACKRARRRRAGVLAARRRDG